MVNFKIMIILVSMTYIAYLDAYELHPRDEEIFNKFIDEC
jgi:hypothetical protein